MPQRGVSSDLPDPDYGKVFHLAPVPLVLIALDRTVVDANRAHLESTATTLEAIIGRDLLEVFAGNPGDPQADARWASGSPSNAPVSAVVRTPCPC